MKPFSHCKKKLIHQMRIHTCLQSFMFPGKTIFLNIKPKRLKESLFIELIGCVFTWRYIHFQSAGKLLPIAFAIFVAFSTYMLVW